MPFKMRGPEDSEMSFCIEIVKKILTFHNSCGFKVKTWVLGYCYRVVFTTGTGLITRIYHNLQYPTEVLRKGVRFESSTPNTPCETFGRNH